MLSDNVKQTIQSAYRQFLKANNLSPRQGQKQMVAAIANTLAGIDSDDNGLRKKNDKPHICVIEAGTGTGKTLAYLLAAIPIARELNKHLVVSTATVALQEQIVNKDLPEIKNSTDFSFNFSLAKGRGRYLCLSKLERILLNTDADKEPGLFEPDFGLSTPSGEISLVDEDALKLYKHMVDKLAAGHWNGDRDRWPNELESAQWLPITTNHRECSGRRCSNVSNCSFFKARDAIEKQDCIVANHDLVLADLALGGGAILPPPEECIYIFDEGHHLADKALSHFAFHTRVGATSKWLDQCRSSLSSLLGEISGAGQVDHYAEQLPAALQEGKKYLEALYPLCQQLMEQRTLQHHSHSQFSADDKRLRFEQGIPPSEFVELTRELESSFGRITRLFNNMNEEVQQAMDDSLCSVPKVDLETWYPILGNWLARAEANLELWSSFNELEQTDITPKARWITVVEFSGSVDFEVCCSPILAAHTLATQLWDECYGAVLTSATLTALGNFNRFMMRTGTNKGQHYSVMPAAFDYSRGRLQVPDFALEANRTDEHTESLIEHLPDLLSKEMGNLVLFSSRKQMENVHEQLPSSVKKNILIQGELTKQAMLNKHKKAIDGGKSSTLFGLASFAEGVDLPGDYCRHVIIAKLPFSVPNDPVEAALAEWIEQQGGNSFMDISVPDAGIRLVQACGRLLRRETDSGTITLLDKRFLTKRYGKLLLQSLPGYAFD